MLQHLGSSAPIERRFLFTADVEAGLARLNRKVEGVVRAGDRREILTAMTLRGDDITFMLTITLDGHTAGPGDTDIAVEGAKD